MLVVVLACLFGFMVESSAMQRNTFIGAVYDGSFEELEKRLLSLTDESEKVLAREFMDLYWKPKIKSGERSATLNRLGDDGGDVFQAAEFIARRYFTKMQEDIFSVPAAQQAVKWLARVCDDGKRFRNYENSRDGASLQDLLLIAQTELSNRKKFESKLGGSEKIWKNLLRKLSIRQN